MLLLKSILTIGGSMQKVIDDSKYTSKEIFFSYLYIQAESLKKENLFNKYNNATRIFMITQGGTRNMWS